MAPRKSRATGAARRAVEEPLPPTKLHAHIERRRMELREVLLEVPRAREKLAGLEKQLRETEQMPSRVRFRRALELEGEIEKLREFIREHDGGRKEMELLDAAQPFLEMQKQHEHIKRANARKMSKNAREDPSPMPSMRPLSPPREAVADGAPVEERPRKRSRREAIAEMAALPAPPPGKSGISVVTSSGDGGVDEEHLLHEALTVIDPSVRPNIDVESSERCPKCGKAMLVAPHESRMDCTCGVTVKYLDATSASMAYGEDVEFTSFSYTRASHFKEWLKCFQGKETSEVPAEDIEAIMRWLIHERIPLAHVKRDNVKDAMRALGFFNHYDHAPQVCYRITAVPPPRMSPEQEEKLCHMFSAIQLPFAKHRPPERKNFLSYGYCLYKFCEILGYEEFLPCFSLLKGDEKLLVQDAIFQKICGELDWEFIPSTRPKVAG